MTHQFFKVLCGPFLTSLIKSFRTEAPQEQWVVMLYMKEHVGQKAKASPNTSVA